LQKLIGPLRKTPYSAGIRQTLAAVAKCASKAFTAGAPEGELNGHDARFTAPA
jgi:hypothetical protein